MARKLLKNRLVPKNSISDELRKLPNSNVFISNKGNVYADYGNNLVLPLKLKPNPKNGYIYVGIRFKGKSHNISKRVHRLVAQLFISNPNKYNVVGHKDNNKTNNCVDNLYWTTIKENTQKAFNDGLMVNAKGFDDSQSIPVDVYNRNGDLIETCGSVSEAAIKYNITKTGILYQCNNKPKKVRKKFIFRYNKDVL